VFADPRVGDYCFAVVLKRFFSKRWVQRLVFALAIAYPACLAAVAISFRFVGERFWVLAAAMFLPRIGFGLPLVVLVPLLVALGNRRLLALQGLSLLVLVFPLMDFVPPGPGPSAKKPGFRLLSFNVNSSASGRDGVFSAIAALDPDVLVLQETTDFSKLDELVRRRFPTVELSTQFLIASRWPIRSTTEPPRIAYRDRERSPRFLRHVIDTPLGPVTLYNVHPLSPRESFYDLRGESGMKNELRSGRIFSGPAADSFAANSALRALQIRTFARMASKETGPVVVAGDLNQPGPSPLLSGELGAFRDAFREAGWGFGYTFPGAAFKGRRTPKVPWMRLDRIFLRGPIAATRFVTACAGVSDHLCVAADIAGTP